MLLVTLLANRVLSSAALATPDDALKSWAAALKRGAIEDVLKSYEDSKEVVTIQSSGRVRKGIAEVRKEWELAFNEVAFDDIALNDLVARRNGDVAWATCRFRALTTRKSDQARFKLEIDTSFALTRSADTWRIAFEPSTAIVDVPRV
jgi:ketosteroid isomerase-like protein